MPIYLLLIAATAIALKKFRDGADKNPTQQRREQFRGDTGNTWVVYSGGGRRGEFDDFIITVFVLEGGVREVPVLVYAISTAGNSRVISTDPAASKQIVTMAINDLRIGEKV